MRIALVIERFEPHGGGVEAVAWRVAHGLVAAGDDVHVFARTAAAEHEGMTVRSLGGPSGWQPLRVWAFSRAAAGATRAGNFDAIQTFSRTRHQDVFRAGGGCHAAYMERAYGRVGRVIRLASPRHALALSIEADVFANSGQTILCNSEMVRDEIRERYAVPDERLAVIVNGVDTEAFHPRRAREGRAFRDAHPAGRVWLLVGSGFARKGVETALRALALRPTDEALWIAGSDDPAPWLGRARALGIQDRVQFLGHRRDLAGLYAVADALLLPTRYDAFANVCLEAAASGLPVVTSGANGAAGWIGDGGRVVASPDDAEGFAAALGELADEATREQVSHSARARAETATWAHHVAALRELYAKVPR